jgi:hypothetical protein
LGYYNNDTVDGNLKGYDLSSWQQNYLINKVSDHPEKSMPS